MINYHAWISVDGEVVYLKEGSTGTNILGSNYTRIAGLDRVLSTNESAALDFATAAQGSLANNAVQPGDNLSDLTNDVGYVTTDDQTAGEVSVTPTGNLNSTTVQLALQEHQGDIDGLVSVDNSQQTQINQNATDIDNLEANAITDHGSLSGLSDDDHVQYLNQTRGDVRYYTKSQIDSLQLVQDDAISLNSAKTSFPEAPTDGQAYVRQNAGWSVLPASSNSDGYSLFGIWSEENAAMGNNAYEWAFGNGATTQNNRGILVPVDGLELFAIGISSNSTMTNTVVSVERNGVNVAQTNPSNGNNQLTTLATPIVFNTGQNVNFRTITAGGGANAQVVGWFRKLSTSVAENEHSFLTSLQTAAQPLPAVNQPLPFPTPDAVLYAPNGFITYNNDGTYTLNGGVSGASYKAIGCIRGSTYVNGTDFYGARIKDGALNNYGNQSIVYSNAATNLFSAQPFCSGVITVPANTSVTVGLYLDFVSGTAAQYSPARSFLSLEKLR